MQHSREMGRPTVISSIGMCMKWNAEVSQVTSNPTCKAQLRNTFRNSSCSIYSKEHLNAELGEGSLPLCLPSILF